VGDEAAYRVGVVGHRRFESRAVADFVAGACRSVLSEAARRHGTVAAVSALAEGADTLFAEAALELGLPLDAVKPFARYDTDFPEPPARARYRRLVRAARSEMTMPHRDRSDDAYASAMRTIVERCDLLLIAWNGAPSPSRAGTAAAVAHAIGLGRPWIHLDVRTRRVRGAPGPR
jgi:hypothetical protein